MLVLHCGSCTFIGHGVSDTLTKVRRNDFWRAALHQADSGSLDKQTGHYKQHDRGHLSHKLGWLLSAPASPPWCPHLISHGFLIRLKRLQYWLCGRGFSSFALSAELAAIVCRCGGIDQLVRWHCGQGLSVLMPAWQMCCATAVTQLPFEHVTNKWDCFPEFVMRVMLP